MKVLAFVILAVTLFHWPAAFADRVVRAEIQTVPPASLASEFGLIYENTGLVPGSLRLYCQKFVDEDEWDGIVPGEEWPCGSRELQIRLTSLGLSAFYLNYSIDHPLIVNLHVDPNVGSIRSILGTYRGAKAGAGIGFGGRTMILRNEDSGVWGTVAQVVIPRRKSEVQSPKLPMDIGIDISFPWLEVYLREPADVRQHISALKDQVRDSDPKHAGKPGNTAL